MTSEIVQESQDEAENKETVKLYNQFLLDVPRVDLFIDSELYSGNGLFLEFGNLPSCI